MLYKFIAVFTCVLLVGCASTPTVFNTPVDNAPAIIDVMGDEGDKFAGQTVRWAGEIISVKNQSEDTWIEVLHRPIGSSGRPKDGESEGRFYIKVAGFLEPKEYAEGRSITAVGNLSGFVSQKVGEFDYRYPVVDTEKDHQKLWAERKASNSYWHTRSSLYLDFPWHYSPYRGFGTRVILIKNNETE